MIDCGAEKSCISSSFKFLEKFEKNNIQAKLVCANGENLNCKYETELSFKMGRVTHSHVFIIVDNLGSEAILGMDFIEKLSFDSNSNFVNINNQRLPLVKKMGSKYGILTENIFVEPSCLNLVANIKNPFYANPKIKFVICESFEKPSGKYVLNSILHSNDSPTLNVILSNINSQTSFLPNGSKICLVEPFHLENQINGIKLVEDSVTTESFQKSRIDKFGPIEDFSFGSIGSQLNDYQKDQLQKLFKRKHLALARTSKDIGRLSNFRLTLPLHDERDVAYCPPRPIPPHLKASVQAEIEKLGEMDIVEKGESDFNIPLVILKKRDGSIKVSLDARLLNSKLKDDRHPLPNMNEILSRVSDQISGSKQVFITIADINKAYYHMQIAEEDRHKTAFSYNNEHYICKRMLYGLSTAPAAWSRAMCKIFSEKDNILIYLDDTILINSSFEDHLTDLEWFLDKCISNGLNLSMSKMHICQPDFEFLGHKIDHTGIKPLERHIKAISEFPEPKTKRELKRFLGMAQFNAKMVPNASVTLSCLHKLCSQRVPYIWLEKHQDAFDKIKKDLQGTRGLFHRNPKWPLYLTSDASQLRAAGTLYQKNRNDEFEVVGYFSKIFNPAESRLSSRHREILALTYSVRYFEYHLIGTKFNCLIDHKSMLYLFREHFKSALTTKMSNCMIYLLNFDFQLIHVAGTDEKIASSDYLSRLPVKSISELEKMSHSTEIPDKIFQIMHLPVQANINIDRINAINLRSLAKPAINKDKQFSENICQDLKYNFGNIDTPLFDTNSQIKDDVPTQEEPNIEICLSFGDICLSKPEIVFAQDSCSKIKDIKAKIQLKTRNSSKNYVLIDDLVYKVKNGGNKRLYLPQELALEFISYVHALHLHPGAQNLAKIVEKHVFVYNLRDKCSQIVKNCLKCIKLKPAKAILPGKFKQHPFEALPFSKTGLDLYDLGKPDRNNKRYLVTVTCHLTNYCDAIPVSNKTDQLVANAFMTLILRYGICGDVILDNGQEFGPIFKKICDQFHINTHRVSAYHSRSNGKAERSHREILIKQRLLGSTRKNWSIHWPYVQFIINNTPKESLNGLTPSECLFGRSLLFPIENEITKDQSLAKKPFTEALCDFTEKLWPELCEFQISRYNKLIKNPDGTNYKLEKGDYCLVWKPKMTDGKLSTQWAGPYRVIKHYSPSSYLLTDPETKTKYRRSCRHIRPLGAHLNSKFTEKYKSDLDIIDSNLNLDQPRDNGSYSFKGFPFMDDADSR